MIKKKTYAVPEHSRTDCYQSGLNKGGSVIQKCECPK